MGPPTVSHDRSSLWKAHGTLLALLLGALAVVAAYDFTHACRQELGDIAWDCKGAVTLMGGVVLVLHAVTSSLGIRTARDAERARPRAYSRGQAFGIACIVHALSLGAMLLLVRGCR
jgi:hypothetical protein